MVRCVPIIIISILYHITSANGCGVPISRCQKIAVATYCDLSANDRGANIHISQFVPSLASRELSLKALVA